MKHSVPLLHRLAASTVHQMQRNVLKYLRKASLNHRNLPRTGGHWNAWIQLQLFYCLSRADGFFFPPPLFRERHYISGCRCLIIWLAAGLMLMNAVDPVNS